MVIRTESDVLSLSKFIEGNLSETIVPYDGHVFEDNFDWFKDQYERLEWNRKTWHRCFYIIAAYLLIIYFLQEWMKPLKAFRLNTPLAVWNFSLAFISIILSWRAFLDCRMMLMNYGLYYSICSTFRYPFMDFWGHIMKLSKVVELGDTLFLVLRKKPVIFLHWYHHATVLFLAFYGSTENYSNSRWFILANSTVHSIMYTYYGICALGYRIPKPIAMFITTIQIVQMLVGIFGLTYIVVNKFLLQRTCHASTDAIAVGIAIYFSYFILFVKFFIEAYLKYPSKQKQHNVKTKKIR